MTNHPSSCFLQNYNELDHQICHQKDESQIKQHLVHQNNKKLVVENQQRQQNNQVKERKRNNNKFNSFDIQQNEYISHKDQKSAKMEQVKAKMAIRDEHNVAISQLQARYETNVVSGLTNEQAARRLKIYGSNKSQTPQIQSWCCKFIKLFFSPFSILLLLAAILNIIIYKIHNKQTTNLAIAVVIFMIIIINTIVRHFSDYTQYKAHNSHKAHVPNLVSVIRSGHIIKVMTSQLVPGDIVFIELGRKIAADMRVIQANMLRVDRIAQDGHSYLQSCNAYVNQSESILASKNIVFASQLCKEGSGKGLVYATGKNTLFYSYNKFEQTNESPSPRKANILGTSLHFFQLRLSIVIAIIALVFFGVGFAVKIPTIINITFVVGFIMANVPLTLSLCLIFILGQSVKKLSKKGILLKNYDAIETLSKLTCICVDKTGTLTQNKQQLSHLWHENQMYDALNKQKDKLHSFNQQQSDNSHGFKRLHECAVITSTAIFQQTQNNNSVPFLKRQINGTQIDGAIIRYFQPIQDINLTRSRSPIILDQYKKQCRFNYGKYTCSIHQQNNDDSFYCLYTKGTPEIVANLCTKVYQNGKQIDITEQ